VHRPALITLENTRSLLRVLKIIKARLEALGYAVAFRVLNPSEFQHPHRRERVYVQGFHVYTVISKISHPVCMAELSMNFQQKLEDMYNSLLALVGGRAGFPLKSILIPVGYEGLKDLVYSTKREHFKKGDKWKTLHSKMFFELTGDDRPTDDAVANFTIGFSETGQVAFDCMCRREQEVVMYLYMFFRAHDLDPFDFVIDTSQMLGRVPTSNKGVTCITPNRSQWTMREMRQILGPEFCALQGISRHRFQHMHDFSNKFLTELAGNAYNGTCFLYLLVAVMMALP